MTRPSKPKPRGAAQAWRRRSPADAVRPDINVTPLVDVVLVLLIIFMVVAPRMDQDVPVDLPGIFNPDPEVETSMDPVKLSVAKVGEYYIDDQKYDLDGAIAALATEHANEPLRRLVLRADAKLTYKDVREILARSQQVGFPGMSLMVGERHREPGKAQHADAGSTPATTDAAAAPPQPGHEG
jgi:biopolymer transport protein ExbD/biopolymer transport protein TolR